MRTGISLIDVVTAIAVGGILTVLLYRSVVQTNRVVYTIDAMIDMYSEVALFKDRMERDVLGTFIPQGISMAFFKRVMQQNKEETQKKNQQKGDKDTEEAIDEIFVVKRGAQNNLATMTFTTTSPLIVFNETAPRAVRVLYELTPDKERQNRWSLLRYESTDLALRTFNQKRREGTIRGHTILDNIKKLAVRCVVESRDKENKKEKQPKEDQKRERTFEYLIGWDDSVAEEQGRFLPLYVEVKGEVVDERKKRSVPFTFMIPIKVDYFAVRFDKPADLLKQSPGQRQTGTGRGRTLGDMAKGMGKRRVSPQGSKLFEGALSAMQPGGKR